MINFSYINYKKIKEFLTRLYFLFYIWFIIIVNNEIVNTVNDFIFNYNSMQISNTNSQQTNRRSIEKFEDYSRLVLASNKIADRCTEPQV
jgi:hypothetical protein